MTKIISTTIVTIVLVVGLLFVKKEGEINNPITEQDVVTQNEEAIKYNQSAYDEGKDMVVWNTSYPRDPLLFVSDGILGEVRAWNLITKELVATLTGLEKPQGITLDKKRDELYVADSGNGMIKKFAIADILLGQNQPMAMFGGNFQNSNFLKDVALYEKENREFVLASYDAEGKVVIRAFTLEGALSREWEGGAGDPSSLEVDSKYDRVFVVDSKSKKVKVFNPNGVLQTVLRKKIFQKPPQNIRVYECDDDGYIFMSLKGKGNIFEILERKTLKKIGEWKEGAESQLTNFVFLQIGTQNYPQGALLVEHDRKYVEPIQWGKVKTEEKLATCLKSQIMSHDTEKTNLWTSTTTEEMSTTTEATTTEENTGEKKNAPEKVTKEPEKKTTPIKKEEAAPIIKETANEPSSTNPRSPSSTKTSGSPLSLNKTLKTPSSSIEKDTRYEDGVASGEDSVTVFVAPIREESMLFVTHKTGNKIEIWDLALGRVVSTLINLNNPNGITVDEREGAIYVADTGSRALRKYVISEVRQGNSTPKIIFGNKFESSQEPLGVTVLHEEKRSLVYATYRGTGEKYVRVFNTDGTFEKEWSTSSIGESIKADNENKVIFVADNEKNAVKAYKPDGTFVKDFGRGLFLGALGGIDIYKCGADGYIIISDPSAGEFKIFDRKTWKSLAAFKVKSTDNTDGIAITETGLPRYRNGGFFSQSRNKYVEGVWWEKIATATGMTMCVQ